MAAGLIQRDMVRISLMAIKDSALTRRTLVAGLSASVISAIAGGASAAGTVSLALQARRTTLSLRPGLPATPVWELAAATSARGVHLARGDRCATAFQNNLAVPLVPVWRGLDGVAAAEPFLGRGPTAPRLAENSIIPMLNAGTLMADLRLLGDGLRRPLRPLAVIVHETGPVAVDRDEVVLIEDWRLAADGAAMVAGSAGGEVTPIYTVNGTLTPDFALRQNERLRLRFINGCQRAVVAVKLDGLDVTVMALDGQPAEPFAARNGALVLAPGGRADVFIDGTAAPGTVSPVLVHDGKEARAIARLVTASEARLRPDRLPPPDPLPFNELPVALSLRDAQRFDVTLATAESGWVRPAEFSEKAAPAWRTKAGRTVVLAVRNSGPNAAVLHLHGHHFRLLDRLDDGWKPYWLDTLAIEPGQTERIAFAATYPGRWLVESVATDWTAPRLVRWYAVE